ncbi:MAG: cyclic nucleotide-binding domain-containing protein, partial [Rhizobiaceae bacterium]
MELTIESALSPAGLLGHSTYVLLVLSMLMRRMVWLRLLVIASAIAGILYASLILTDPVGTFWETLLIGVNIGQLCLTWWLDRTTQFNDRDAEMRLLHFEHLSPSRFRRLLSAGEWQTLPSGTSLTAEGTPVPALYFLRSGTAEVRVAGRKVARCDTGTFVGEMTVATGEPANAGVTLVEDAQVWRIDAARLRAIA